MEPTPPGRLSLSVSDLEHAGMSVPEVRFREEVERFAQIDRDRPTVPGGALFVGDSDIRLWERDGRFEKDFAGLPAVNRGFGGARTWEVLIYFGQIVVPHRPRVIVYCCGDNDIARLAEAGVTSAATGFGLFLDLVRAYAPDVRTVLYLAIHPSPADEPLWGFIRQANARMRQLCLSSELAEFVDYPHLLLDEHQRPKTALFMPDRLHFTGDFYRQLGAFLRPRIETALA